MDIKLLLKKIADYEFTLILKILDLVKSNIVNDYFSNMNVEVWYCYIHDQGFIISYDKNSKIDDIYTHTCGHYCHICKVGDFNRKFIEHYDELERYRKYDLDFKLEWFLNSFYDHKKDKFIDTPQPIELFYNNPKLLFVN